MRLSVLDQSVAVAGRPRGVSIRETVELARRLGIDELVIASWTHGLAARKHSHDLLAREFSIGGDE